LARRELLIAPDHAGDVAHWSEPDGEGGLVIHSVQDVAPVLERNKALQTHNDGYSPSRELRRVAFIPNIIRLKWLNEEGWDAWRPDLYADRLAAKLNDPEWRHLRTAPGRVACSNGVLR
jgi:hypothetical protein